MAKEAKIRLRFVFNQAAKGSEAIRTDTINNVAQAAAENIAFSYKQRYYLDTVRKIKTLIEKDAQREITNAAQRFKRAMIGMAGYRGGIDTNITTVIEKAAASRAAGIATEARLRTGPWQKRTKKYMAWKKKKGYGTNWFRNKGDVLGKGSVGTGGFWTDTWGPVQVTVQPTGRAKDPLKTFESKFNKRAVVRVQVATISVKAFQKITPTMLPGLKDGDLTRPSPVRAITKHLPEPERARLGGNPKKRVPYRPGLEPFLTFVLTRAIPNAFFRRIEQGIGPIDTGRTGIKKAAALPQSGMRPTRGSL